MPVGVVSRPAVTAKLQKTLFKAMEPVSIELRSEAKVYLGVFAWCSRVVCELGMMTPSRLAVTVLSDQAYL